MSPPADRRRLLQVAAATAATAWLPRSAWSQPRLSSTPFALGVASGWPTPEGTVLWTRLIAQGLFASLGSGAITVRWEIARDEAFRDIARSGQAQAVAELAHSVHVEAAGLESDRWYFYRFMLGEWTSPTGRTRTLPAADAPMQKLRIGYASCQRWEHGYFSAWRHLRDEQPDAVLFLGDYIYEYPGAVNAVRMPGAGWTITLADYRARYALYKSDADLQAAHAACPWFLTWDDHEVQNDYAGDTGGNAGPQVDHLARRAAAYQAYYEHMPLPASVLARGLQGLAGGAEMRIHSRHRIGALADLYLLDARQYRHAQACTPGGRLGSGTIDPAACEALKDPARSLLGNAQEAWLDAQLARAGSGWNLLGQSSLLGPRDFRSGPVQAIWNDGWDGYPAARGRLTQALAGHRVPNVAVFGGDVHEHWVGHVKADYARPESASVGVEFCGTSISSRTGPAEQTARLLAENPHFTFADTRWRGYGVADITPARMEVRLRAVDAPERRDSGVHTLAAFAVEAGRARVEKA